MPDKALHVAPNRPVHVALVDPEGEYDFDLQCGRYQTTAGKLLTLPRPAVVQLNALDAKSGEEITILKQWSGKPGDRTEWVISLSVRTERARAEAGEPDTLSRQLEASLSAIQPPNELVEPPTPIRKQVRPAPEAQPRLFDRGTGTDGPAPLSIPLAPAAIGRRVPPQQIPANIATSEILGFILADPNTKNWSDQAVQDLLSTVLIASYKAGHVGLWERK
jgi:hypothetical protein